MALSRISEQHASSDPTFHLRRDVCGLGFPQRSRSWGTQEITARGGLHVETSDDFPAPGKASTNWLRKPQRRLSSSIANTMPPRLHLVPLQGASITQRLLPPSFLLPFLQQQSRSASIISSLSDVPSAYNKRIRRGRGPSSGKGKTSGRGHKGQGQHGKVPYGFQGGQTIQEVVKGSRGEKNPYVYLPTQSPSTIPIIIPSSTPPRPTMNTLHIKPY